MWVISKQCLLKYKRVGNFGEGSRIYWLLLAFSGDGNERKRDPRLPYTVAALAAAGLVEARCALLSVPAQSLSENVGARAWQGWRWLA